MNGHAGEVMVCIVTSLLMAAPYAGAVGVLLDQDENPLEGALTSTTGKTVLFRDTFACDGCDLNDFDRLDGDPQSTAPQGIEIHYETPAQRGDAAWSISEEGIPGASAHRAVSASGDQGPGTSSFELVIDLSEVTETRDPPPVYTMNFRFDVTGLGDGDAFEFHTDRVRPAMLGGELPCLDQRADTDGFEHYMKLDLGSLSHAEKLVTPGCVYLQPGDVNTLRFSLTHDDPSSSPQVQIGMVEILTGAPRTL